MQRASYCIRLWGTDYNDEDGPARFQVEQDDQRGNAWCSRVEEHRRQEPVWIDGYEDHGEVLDLGNWHMPVIDVDVRLTWSVRDAVTELFPDVQWVRSTNNWHAYSDTPIRWTDYCQRMKKLVELGIVQQGYYGAMLSRGASFVRKPGVLKTTEEDGFE